MLKNQTMVPYAFEVKKDRFIMIREPTKEEIGNTLHSDIANDEKACWSPSFYIDEIDDFQISYPKDEANFL